MPFNAKVTFGDSTRQFKVADSATWKSFEDKIRSVHSITAEAPILVTYTDVDGDKIRIDTTDELKDLIDDSVDAKRTAVPFTVSRLDSDSVPRTADNRSVSPVDSTAETFVVVNESPKLSSASLRFDLPNETVEDNTPVTPEPPIVVSQPIQIVEQPLETALATIAQLPLEEQPFIFPQHIQQGQEQQDISTTPSSSVETESISTSDNQDQGSSSKSGAPPQPQARSEGQQQQQEQQEQQKQQQPQKNPLEALFESLQPLIQDFSSKLETSGLDNVIGQIVSTVQTELKSAFADNGSKEDSTKEREPPVHPFVRAFGIPVHSFRPASPFTHPFVQSHCNNPNFTRRSPFHPGTRYEARSYNHPGTRENNIVNTWGPALWFNVRCDGCSKHAFSGTRNVCQTCPNFDLCDSCAVDAKNIHNSQHEFKSVKHPIDVQEDVVVGQLKDMGLVRAEDEEHVRKIVRANRFNLSRSIEALLSA